jgi:PAS domain S-box-containing protein
MLMARRLPFFAIILACFFIMGCFLIPAAARAFPDENKTIRVAVDASYPPFSYIGDDGRLQGIDIDQWRLWEQKTGIPVEFDVTSMDRAYSDLQAGRIDVISELFSTKSRRKTYEFSQLYDYTEPYYPVDVAVFFNRNISGISGIDSLKGFVVGVVAGYDSEEYLRSHDITVREYPTTEAMVLDAKAGKISVFCTDTPAAVYYLYKHGIQDDFLATQPLYTNYLRRAVMKGNSALLKQINDGFARITPEEYRSVGEKWSGSRLYSAEETQKIFLSGLLVAVLAFAALVLVLFWNRTLSRAVNARTSELTRKATELQAAYQQLAANEEMLRSQFEELRKKEQALSESEEKYRAIFNTFIDIYYQKDMNGIITTLSPSSMAISGWEPDELIGRNFLELFADSEQQKTLHGQLLSSGSVHDFELLLKNREGKMVPVSVSSHVISDGNGRPERIEGTIRDISERKTAEEALGLARRKLNVLNAVTFQDIQNAVFALTGYLGLEKGKAADENLKKYIERGNDSVRRISNSLAFAKAYQEMGMNPPRWQNVLQVFLFAISRLDLSRISRKVSLKGLEIYADPLLEKVFYVLAENVVRHGGHATEITFSCRETDDGLLLIFEDNGAGIAAENKEQIFQRGYGGNREMGLFLAREILSITGISIRETGEYGNGARFELFVPKDAYRFRPEQPAKS